MKNKLILLTDILFIITEMFMRCIISIVVLFVLSEEISKYLHLIGIVSIFWILYPLVTFFDKLKKEQEK